MQFLEFNSFLQKCELTYAFSANFFPSPNTCISYTIYGIFSLLKKRGLSYAISRFSFYSTKNVVYHINIGNYLPLSKNVDYHLQFLEFLSLFQIIWEAVCNFLNFLPSPKMCTMICNF